MKKIDFVKDSNIAESISNMYNLNNLMILNNITKTTKISRLLTEQYKSVRNDTWLAKVSITVINSLLTQNRKVFILKRDFLVKLLKSDTNHYNEATFSNSNYQLFIEHISKFLCKIEKVKRHKHYVMMCIVTHKDLLKLINADIVEQEKEVRLFITGEIKEETSTLNNSNIELDTSILVPNTTSKFKRIKKDN